MGRVDRADLDPVDLAVRDRVGLADLADLAVPHPVDPVVLAHTRDPVGRADLDLEDLAVPDRVGLGPVVLAVPHPVDPVVLAHIRDPVGRADLDRVDRADLGMNRVDPAGRVDRVDLGMNRVDPAGRVDRVAQAMNLVDPGDPVDRADLVERADLVDRAGPAGLAIRADRHRRRTRRGVRTTGVAPRWAAPGMRLTASARPVTVRRLRPHNTDGVGMAGLHPERRRLSGTDPRPRVAGAVHRLPVVGTAHGTVRRATWQSRSVISDRSITTGTTRSRCSTQCSGDGASGSSESGFRCTDTTQNFTVSGPCLCRSEGREVVARAAIGPTHASAGK